MASISYGLIIKTAKVNNIVSPFTGKPERLPIQYDTIICQDHLTGGISHEFGVEIELQNFNVNLRESIVLSQIRLILEDL